MHGIHAQPTLESATDSQVRAYVDQLIIMKILIDK